MNRVGRVDNEMPRHRYAVNNAGSNFAKKRKGAGIQNGGILLSLKAFHYFQCF